MIRPSNLFGIIVCCFALVMSGFVLAQDEVSESSDDVVSVETQMQNKPYVQLRSLDKVTARTMTFDAQVGTTVTFGHLYIRVQTCRQSQPIDEPESAAFLQIWEDSIDKGEQDPNWVFSGWMFASSPALSAMDHPAYDIWVVDCKNASTSEKETVNPAG